MWNTLDVGDTVVVHGLDPHDLSLAQRGVVAFVEVRPERRGGNNVGIRLSPSVDDRATWPSRCQVHADSPDALESCNWCTPRQRDADSTVR